MASLLILLSGPLQSWGILDRFDLRLTQHVPTKSGVLGLVCAALNINKKNTKALSKLNQLRFGVRVDNPGTLMVDYHTISNVVNISDRIPQETTPTERHYLSGATFLAGLEGDRTILEKIHKGLLQPRGLLRLGRKSCMLGRSPWLPDGLSDFDLQSALSNYKPIDENCPPSYVEIEDASDGVIRMDTPLHFANRIFAPRFVKTVPLNYAAPKSAIIKN